MKRASVSEAKNGLSGLLDEVRSGETVLITHHGKPVARIEAYSAAEGPLTRLLRSWCDWE